MSIGIVECVMRRLGLSAAPVELRTARAQQLALELEWARGNMRSAAEAHARSSRDMQLRSLESAQHATSIGIAVQGVVDAMAAKKGDGL